MSSSGLFKSDLPAWSRDDIATNTDYVQHSLGEELPLVEGRQHLGETSVLDQTAFTCMSQKRFCLI